MVIVIKKDQWEEEVQVIKRKTEKMGLQVIDKVQNKRVRIIHKTMKEEEIC